MDAAGSEVTGIAPGDAVVALVFQGGFADYSIAEAGRTFPIPQPMDFETASTVPVVYQTSLFALRERAALRAGEWLLVHAGASGVGTSAIQIGKAFGARVIATAGSADKLEFCKRNGADHAIDYSDAAWVDQVKQLTGGRGRGCDLRPGGRGCVRPVHEVHCAAGTVADYRLCQRTDSRDSGQSSAAEEYLDCRRGVGRLCAVESGVSGRGTEGSGRVVSGGQDPAAGSGNV